MTLMQNQAFRRDVARALAAHNFDVVGDGRIYVPGAHAYMGGVFSHDVNGLDLRMDPNLLPAAALIDMLSVYFQGTSQQLGFYIAPFSGNVAPVSTLTAANFAATQTEFTGYSESGRPAWTPPAGALSAASINNSASPAVFTISVASSSVYGFGFLTSATKSGTDGVLVAASLLSAARTGLAVGDKLNVQYSFTAADAG